MLASVLLLTLPFVFQDPEPAPSAAVEPPALSELNLDAWREHLQPAPEELRWEEIPWQSSLSAGFAVAREQVRPLLFWAMNGHPLGCT